MLCLPTSTFWKTMYCEYLLSKFNGQDEFHPRNFNILCPISVCHILKGHVRLELANWFQLDVVGRCWHALKLLKPRIDRLRGALRLSFRRINKRNRLQLSVVIAAYVELFQRQLDSYYAMFSLTHNGARTTDTMYVFDLSWFGNL